MSLRWTQREAIELCVKLESFAPRFGCHIALSGGCLYKEGERKDADIIIYRVRQAPAIDFDGFFEEAAKHGVAKLSGFGFCHKAVYNRKPIDFLSPEEGAGEYPKADPADKLTRDDLLNF